jgi:hypothetical protein
VPHRFAQRFSKAKGLRRGHVRTSITRKTYKVLPQYKNPGESDAVLLSGAEDLVPILIDDANAFSFFFMPPRPVANATNDVRCYRPRAERLFARSALWLNQKDPTDVFLRSISSRLSRRPSLQNLRWQRELDSRLPRLLRIDGVDELATVGAEFIATCGERRDRLYDHPKIIEKMLSGFTAAAKTLHSKSLNATVERIRTWPGSRRPAAGCCWRSTTVKLRARPHLTEECSGSTGKTGRGS